MNKIILLLLGIFVTHLISAQTVRYGQKYTKSNKPQPPNLLKGTNAATATKKSTISKKKVTTTNRTCTPATASSSTGDWNAAKKFADKIAGLSGRYVFLQERTSASQDALILRYIPSSIQNRTAYLNKSCKECMDIEFKKNQGVKRIIYAFSHVWGNFSDLFPVWKALFKPGAQTKDYAVSDQNVLVEWNALYGGKQVIFGRLGTAWYIKM